jgi:hypothetical protein
VALGGRLVAAGLGTLESALRGGDDAPAGRREEPSRPAAPASEPAARSSFAPVSEPAFEPADGVTAPARRPGAVTRRSSADAAARATPGPRPAKRATAKSLPPNLRPVGPPTTAPVEAAAGAADPGPAADAPTGDATTARKTTSKTTASKAPAPAKKTTGRKAAASGTTAVEPAKKATTRKAATKKATAEKSPATPPSGAPEAAGEGSPAS